MIRYNNLHGENKPRGNIIWNPQHRNLIVLSLQTASHESTTTKCVRPLTITVIANGMEKGIYIINIVYIIYMYIFQEGNSRTLLQMVAEVG